MAVIARQSFRALPLASMGPAHVTVLAVIALGLVLAHAWALTAVARWARAR